MKRCPKDHDNPDNAKFCRICGYNFDNSFRSQLKRYWNYFISFLIRMINTIISVCKTWIASMKHSPGFTPDMFPTINLSPRSVVNVDFRWHLLRKLKFIKNADYIEDTSFMSTMCRIARKCKLGLFDKNKKKVVLKSKYDNITRFDTEHILIEKKEKKGIFSMKKMGLIVPIRFERIDAFRNSIVKCYKGTKSFYYDINGNRME